MKWREQVKKLLQKAEMDIIAVEELLDSTRVSDAIIGFHLQQAVEKLFKALLAANDIPYRKTHDIRELIDLLIVPLYNVVAVFRSFRTADIQENADTSASLSTSFFDFYPRFPENPRF